MKANILLCLFVLMSFRSFRSTSVALVKIVRWDCNASGVAVINAKCRVRSLSRTLQIANVEAQVTQRIENVLISYFLYYKTGIGAIAWRQIIKLENIDVCHIERQNDNLPVFNSFKEYYQKIAPTLPQKCPVLPGKYSAFNVTVIDNTDSIEGATLVTGKVSPGQFPNGVYRHVVRIHSKKDPKGFMLFWHTEIYEKMGDKNF